jgi:hypothetical protein
MDFYLIAVWGSLVFAVIGVCCLGVWFFTGRQNSTLRILGGCGAIAAALSISYMTYVA